MNYFVYSGKRSSDYGIYISGENTFNAPERDLEYTQIKGKNGDLIISNQRFKNISVAYPAFIRTKFNQNSDAAKAWLLWHTSYQRLEDTYHPEYFRMGIFSGPIDFDMRFLNRSGETSLMFTCKPQRWRKDGEIPITFDTQRELYNELFPALPLIKVNGTGAGNLRVGECTVQIKALDGYVILDSDSQNAYKGTLNKNSTIYAPQFPVLERGKNFISWDGGITSVEITPRWWTI
jgi:phage-related protein